MLSRSRAIAINSAVGEMNVSALQQEEIMCLNQ